jgi:GTP-binding protein EngB required for normal cell division
MDTVGEKNEKMKYSNYSKHQEGSFTTNAVLMSSLRKAYLLLDSLHGPKDKDIQMLNDLAKTGIAHQLVLTKLECASPTIWKEIHTALKDNPDPGTEFKSASRSPLHQSSEVVERLTMGVFLTETTRVWV